MNEQQANKLFEQSISLLQQGNSQEALKLLAKLDQAIPSNPGILYFTATGYSISGNKHKAIQVYERVLRLNPNFIEAYNNLALDLAYLGEHQKAISFIDKALTIHPNFIEAIDNKGCCLSAMGMYEEAKAYFEAALRINPNDTMALANLGATFNHLGQTDLAEIYANKLIELNPKDYKAHLNLGTVCMQQEHYQEAVEHLAVAYEYQPNDLETLTALGISYARLDRYDLAAKHVKQVLDINPHHGGAHSTLGIIHQDLGEHDKALEFFNAPIDDKYRLTLREYNRSLSYLHLGNLESGWRDYAWRWKESGLTIPYLHSHKPLWDGAATDKRVFIWHEQGIGDQLLFSTLLNEASAIAPNLFVRLDQRLIPLFERSFPHLRFLSPQESVSDADFDAHLPMGDLPRLFRSTLEAFRQQPSAYLQADTASTQSLLCGPLKHNHRPICNFGLSWATKGRGAQDRNLPIVQLIKEINEASSPRLIDLQYSDTIKDRTKLFAETGIQILHLDQIDSFNDLDSLASLIMACNAVITCSNSTAHLAGALGKDTYLLVPFSRNRHWYWSHISQSSHSLWYPSIRVIPQTKHGDWDAAIETLQKDLRSKYPPPG